MKKILSRRFLLFLSLLSAIVLFAVLYHSQLLPIKYLAILFGIIFVILVCLYRGECDREHAHPIRVSLLKLCNIILSIAMIMGSFFTLKGNSFIDSITNRREEIVEVDVVVMNDSSYQSLNDLLSCKFGGNTKDDLVNIHKAKTLIEDDIGAIDFNDYSDHHQLVRDLETNAIQAMLIKSVDVEAMDDIEEGFLKKIRVIKKLKIKVPSLSANSAQVTKEPFNVLVLGTDKRGDISRADALSDVNMIATINPLTKQILITSIPRDYYVDLYEDGVNYGKDKLTHSAKKGTKCTVETLEKLFDIDINYYAKFNFTSFEGVVDALGGVEVDIPKYRVFGNDEGKFTTKIYKFEMQPGKTVLDGEHALAFVRERKSFLDGDNIRNRNQMLVLKAIVKKCSNASVVMKLDDVLDSVSESFTTNMSSDDIKSLVNMQLDDLASWDVVSYHLEGEPIRTFEFATVSELAVRKNNPRGFSVCQPDLNTVEKAKGYLHEMMLKDHVLKIEK